MAAEVARQQRGAAAGAGVGPEGAAMHDVTPATVAAARRGRGGGGGGGSKRAQEQVRRPASSTRQHGMTLPGAPASAHGTVASARSWCMPPCYAVT